MLKLNYFLADIFILSAEKQPIKLSWRKIEWLHKDVALTRLARWYDEVDKSGFLAFGRVARSIQTHYLEIINYFERRSTNAASESFNAKIKNFRSQFRGVKDRAFFLFRLSKIYA